MMEKLIKLTPAQIDEAIAIARQSEFHTGIYNNVVICGMGGSGIAGTIVSNLFKDESNTPIIVNKDYNIPSFINENSLVILSSYSGTTEETLSCFKQALNKKANIICISTGYELIQLAIQHKIDYIIIPNGFPPRQALMYSLIQITNILSQNNIIHDKMSLFKDSIGSLGDNVIEAAEEIANDLEGYTPIIYSNETFSGLSIRFQQQLNENAKQFAHVAILPEMNHNELVALKSIKGKFILIEAENSIYMNKRFKFIADRTDHLYIELLGKNDIERLVYGIYLTDWISYFLAKRKGVDPIEVNIIQELKQNLK